MCDVWRLQKVYKKPKSVHKIGWVLTWGPKYAKVCVAKSYSIFKAMVINCPDKLYTSLNKTVSMSHFFIVCIGDLTRVY